MTSILRATAVALVALGGCSNLTSFEIIRAVPQQTIPGDPVGHAAGSLLQTTPFNPFTLDVNLAAEAQMRDTGPIHHVFLESITLTIQSTGNGSCWDFVRSITVSIASTQSGSTLPPTTIATAMQPGCVQTLTLTPTPGVDLQPYIQEGARVSSSGQAIPPAQDVTFDGQIALTAQL